MSTTSPATTIMTRPSVGLGTLGLKESAEAAVGSAIDLGCALIDTGEHYGNLELVGAALKKGQLRKGASPGPCVIAKLSGMPTGDYAQVKERMLNMVALLGVRPEVCLMHWPGTISWGPTDMSPLASPGDFQDKVTSWDDFCASVGEAWSNMKRLQADGLCQEIGTSNFYAHHLEEMAKACEGAKPFANEIFIDVTNPETEFVDAMQQQGIKVLAYRPVAYKPHPDCAKALAARFGEPNSTQTVILAWLLRRGIFPLVKCRGGHIKENLIAPEMLKDQFTAEDLADLARCEVDMRFSAEWFAKIWKTHNATSVYVCTEEDVAMLTSMGVEEAKAKSVLEECGGAIDAAMDMAFS
jgi:diketogulonate reductase-like aldo/keto reductase